MPLFRLRAVRSGRPSGVQQRRRVSRWRREGTMSSNRRFHKGARAVAVTVRSPRPGFELTFAAIADLVMEGARRVSAGLRRRRDARLLAQVDEHMLRDIGITRSEIDRAVRFGRL